MANAFGLKNCRYQFQAGIFEVYDSTLLLCWEYGTTILITVHNQGSLDFLGGAGDFATACNWAYNPTYRPPNWSYVVYPLHWGRPGSFGEALLEPWSFFLATEAFCTLEAEPQSQTARHETRTAACIGLNTYQYHI